MVDVAVVSSHEDLQTCLKLRRIVFIEEQGVPESEEVDGRDDICIHLLAKLEGKPIGAARYQYMDDKAKIQRVCILPEARGEGLGALLMVKILDAIRHDGKVSKAVLGSQTHALGFYEKLGFKAYGDEYLDAGILHRDMEIKL